MGQNTIHSCQYLEQWIGKKTNNESDKIARASFSNQYDMILFILPI